MTALDDAMRLVNEATRAGAAMLNTPDARALHAANCKAFGITNTDPPLNDGTVVEFFVPGNPKPQGSKRHVGRGILIESSKDLGPWRERIALAAHNAMCGQNLLSAPITLTLAFVLPRPKSTPKSRTPPAIKRPDIDKLARACLDAITATLIHDDSQIVDLRATKRLAEIGETPGVNIRVESGAA